jgi:predicted PurR-regulated permease PerM
MQRSQIQTAFFFLLLLGVLGLTFWLFLPFFATLAVAATLAVVIQPLHKRFIRLLRGRETAASFLSLFVIGVLILIPLTFVGTQVFFEAQGVYEQVPDNGETLTNNVTDFLERTLARFVPQLTIDIDAYIGQAMRFAATKLGPFFAGTAQTILNFFLGTIALYYFLKDGPKFVRSVIRLSPLPDTDDKEVLGRLEIAINSIIRGTLIIAMAQGFMTGIGLAIFGVPSPTLWGSMAAIGAVVPGIGTSIVIVPAVIYLFVSQQTVAAIGLLIWGIIAVGLIDNFLGPILVGRGIKIHPLFVLFGVLGGLSFFGPVGFLLGPLVLSLLFALLDIYRIMMRPKAAKTA